MEYILIFVGILLTIWIILYGFLWKYAKKVDKYSDFEIALEYISKDKNIENIFIIGWAQLYNSLLTHPHLENIYLTKINKYYNCDIFFQWVPEDFIKDRKILKWTSNEVAFTINKYKREF